MYEINTAGSWGVHTAGSWSVLAGGMLGQVWAWLL